MTHSIRIRKSPILIAGFAFCAALLCLPISMVQSQRSPGTPAAHSLTAIEHVTVVTMTEQGTVLRDATVIIDQQRIVALSGPVPRGAKRIDGRGKWLIPGLADMHVHLPSDGSMRPPKYPTEEPAMFFDTQDIMTPYLANGVTQIMNLDSVAASVGQRNAIARGEVLGPHMALAGVINGGKGRGRIANTPSDGRQAVRDLQGEGYDFVKPYSDLNVDTFLAIVDEAHKRGLKAVGHIPDAFEGQLESAFVPGFAMVAHAEEFSKHSQDFTDADAARFARLAKKNATWVAPTLVTIRWIASETRSLDEMKASPHLKYVHPLLQSKWIVANRYNKNSTPQLIDYFGRMVVFHQRLVRALKAEGVPMVTGSDALTSGVVGGFSLHEELELLVGAGLTNQEALAAATRLPAQWLGVHGDRGTIEIGKRADLVLLDADPLIAIANSRRIAGVFLSGRFINRARLDAMMADLAQRNTAAKPQYDWNALRGK
ncbi:MAG: amidohydrolase family protein [Novosphingobium sp.]|uniref:amidohydrolase family protein n=1 Tax=Novosphingobium sp. TaxID=1874826 RepID=UPI0032BB0868